MTNTTSRRRLLVGTLAAATVQAVSLAATAQEGRYPFRPVKVIVPFVPGGNADATARIFTEALSKTFGQTFVVDNRGGAGGMIGSAVVAKAEADGYTLLCATPGPILSAWQLAGKDAVYALSDFVPIALLTTVPNVFVVKDDSPIKTFEDLLKSAKGRGTELKAGHPGNGTTGHVNVLQLQHALKAEFIVAGYKGSGPAVQDLLGGQLDFIATDLPSAQQLIKSGRLRAIATVARQRAAALPDVPTLAELKHPGVDAANFTAVMGPKRLPPEVVGRLADAIASALDNSVVVRQIEAIGTVPVKMAGSAFEQFLQQQSSTYTALIRTGLLRAE